MRQHFGVCLSVRQSLHPAVKMTNNRSYVKSPKIRPEPVAQKLVHFSMESVAGKYQVVLIG